MKRRSKVIAWIIGVIVVLLIAIAIIIAFFDWNRLRPMINDKVSQAIGRPFTITGDLTVAWRRDAGEGSWHAWMPWPEFTARDIRVGNPAWAAQPQFAQLDYVRFELSPFGLLVHRIVIPQIQLGHPVIDLERDKQGRATWTFDLPQDNSDQPSRWQLDLGAIGFDHGQVGLDDASSAIKLQTQIEPLQQAIPYDQIIAQQTSTARADAGKTVGTAGSKAMASAASAPATAGTAGAQAASTPPTKVSSSYVFAWQTQGTFKGNAVKGTGKTGGVLALQRADQPFPVQADVHIGDSHIAFAGTLTDPVHLGALDVQLWFSGSSMAKLYPIIGVTLPDTPPYATEGHLRANLGKQGSRFSYQNFKGRVGGSDLSGDVLFTTGAPRPKLSGDLHSKLLQFTDLAPLIGADSNAEKKQTGKPAVQPPDRVLPAEPFRTDRWNVMDADVHFSAAKIVRDKSLPFDSLSTHLILTNRDLKLEPLNFGMAGGTIESNIELDGSQTPMHGNVKLRARHLKLKQLFPDFAPMRTSFGEINGDAALTARGNSVAALMGTADGELKLLMNDGAISKTLLEMAGLNVGNIVMGKLFGDKTVQVNCAATDMVAKQGLVDSRLFALDTSDAIINVSGTVNFANENLDMDVRPHTKGFRVFSLRSPLYVKGTLKNPSVGVQAGTLIMRGGGAVALGVLATPVAALIPLIVPNHNDDSNNTCRTVLQEMSGPSSTQPKAAAPAAKTH